MWLRGGGSGLGGAVQRLWQVMMMAPGMAAINGILAVVQALPRSATCLCCGIAGLHRTLNSIPLPDCHTSAPCALQAAVPQCLSTCRLLS